MSVPKEITTQLSHSEITRQNAIFELIETEREFVTDLENTIKLFIAPLTTSSIIPEFRRIKFIDDVFSNLEELVAVNSKLLKRLIARQNEGYIVEKIGDLFINASNEFYPYIHYGAKQVFAKSILDEEKSSNPEFSRFIRVLIT